MTARVFWLHVDRFDAPDRRVWAVQTRGAYRTGRYVDVAGVALETVFRGRTARQPRAYLRGKGVVTQRGATITIRPA